MTKQTGEIMDAFDRDSNHGYWSEVMEQIEDNEQDEQAEPAIFDILRGIALACGVCAFALFVAYRYLA